jgi:hypothetical protein
MAVADRLTVLANIDAPSNGARPAAGCLWKAKLAESSGAILAAVTPFEVIVRAFLETARLHARTLERALWIVLIALLAAMLAAGIAQTLG